jgi:hypothetical protein
MSDRRPPHASGDGHPDEALAAFADGTATQDEHAMVLAHLQGCALCRRDVEMARRAIDALATLPEAPSPTLDPESIVRRAGNVVGMEPAAARRRGLARLGSGVVGGGLAAGLVAAGLVLVFATGIIKLGGGGTSATGGAASTGGGAEVPAESRDFALGKTTTDFSRDSIDRLAAQEATRAQDGAASGAGPELSASPEGALLALRSRAESCTGPQVGDGESLVSVVLARFDGRPAFVAVTHSAPANQRVVRVIVTDRATCSVLYTARASNAQP